MVRETLPTLIIVAGLPATGKTTLARHLAAHFALPLIHKDIIKEALCDVLGCADLEESRRLGLASMMLLYQFAEIILRASQSCIIESYFHPEFATPDLLALHQHSPFIPIQIHCHTSLSLALERYQQRFESGERHPGHMDQVHLPAMRAALLTQPEIQSLAIGGHVIELDTTDFAAINYEALFSQVQEFMGTKSKFIEKY
jgi:AAA domain-containing protein